MLVKPLSVRYESVYYNSIIMKVCSNMCGTVDWWYIRCIMLSLYYCGRHQYIIINSTHMYLMVGHSIVKYILH